MKHLKKFESYSVETNEGLKDTVKKAAQKTKKFFKGHESKEAYEKAQKKLMNDLDKMEKKAEKNDKMVFDRKDLEKQAKENKFLGGFKETKSAKTGKVHVVYNEGTTEFEDLASGAAGATNQNR